MAPAKAVMFSMKRSQLLVALAMSVMDPTGSRLQAADDAIRNAATFYASFDSEVKGDFGGGSLKPSTRFNHPAAQGQFVFEPGFDSNVFRIAPNKGVHGGALEPVDILPRNGRIFFPARGNIAFREGGWSGSASFWLKTDPNTMLKTSFCDPLQITQKGASNGGLWLDFNDAKPKQMRMGSFPAVPEGGKAVSENDPQAPLIRMSTAGFTADQWRHVVLVWENFDTGRADARIALYVDGKLIGELKGREIAMNWDLDKAGIYVAVSYIGLLDELALFNRPLTPAEITRLREEPGLLSALKKRR
jgi:hypothetical protein